MIILYWAIGYLMIGFLAGSLFLKFSKPARFHHDSVAVFWGLMIFWPGLILFLLVYTPFLGVDKWVKILVDRS